jgi:DNA recombination protein RmuC
MIIQIIILILLVLTLSLAIVTIIVVKKSKVTEREYTNLKESLQKNLVTELRQNRVENQAVITHVQEMLIKTLTDIGKLQTNQIDLIGKQTHSNLQNNQTRMHELRESIEKRLVTLQQDNNQKLEQMRETVDEKLHKTLEKRLGESFKLVSERLEHVHKGLGEMQSLAAGVGDLKKVLTNVKTRGTWGEVQCANLLEQILTSDQYDSQVMLKDSSKDRIDFAIKLPGKSTDKPVYLPLDSKCPLEGYLALTEAQERGDIQEVTRISKELQRQILSEAKSIKDKYISPPDTTDFAIMYLPVEGLYAEVLRLPNIQDELQNKHRVILAGPTTLAALLNSLQMGFKTLAIEKRSSEVWSILEAVKQEFVKFGDLLDKTHKKLIEAGNTIEKASTKSRTIQRKLRAVESVSIEEISTETQVQQAPFQLFQEPQQDSDLLNTNQLSSDV